MNFRGQPLRYAVMMCCVALAALAVAACGSDDSATNTSATDTSATDTSPTGLPPLGKNGTALEAGEYQTTKFTPQITFKVGKGWQTASSEVRDYFDLVRTRSAFRALAFERVTRVGSPKAPSVAVPAPTDLVSWLRKHPKLLAGKPKKTTVGGKPATRVDVRVKSAAPRKQRPASCERPCLTLFHPSDGRPVSYEPGDKLRILILESGGKQLTITIAAPKPKFDRFFPQAEKVLATVKFAD